MTALVVGSTDEITTADVEVMIVEARRLLAETPPITVTLGRVLYHPEAIVLGAQPRTLSTRCSTRCRPPRAP
jgi:hypothetical protein